MDRVGVPLGQVDWESPALGLRQKVVIRDGTRFRLMELSDGFEELAWCQHGHMGYVLEGQLIIDTPVGETHLEPGSVLYLPKGDPHKARVPTGGKAVLLVVDDAPHTAVDR